MKLKTMFMKLSEIQERAIPAELWQDGFSMCILDHSVSSNAPETNFTFVSIAIVFHCAFKATCYTWQLCHYNACPLLSEGKVCLEASSRGWNLPQRIHFGVWSRRKKEQGNLSSWNWLLVAREFVQCFFISHHNDKVLTLSRYTIRFLTIGQGMLHWRGLTSPNDLPPNSHLQTICDTQVENFCSR